MIHLVDIPIYRCTVVFLIEATKEEWLQFASEHKEQITDLDSSRVIQEYNESKTIGWVIDTEGQDYLCYISDVNRMGLVAHELFHTAHSILFDRGCLMDASSEPWAYLIEFLTNKFYNLIDEETDDTGSSE